METLRVDFNRRRNGRVISSITRASGPIALGDVVEIYQPGEDDMTSRAIVSAMFDDGRVELTSIDETFEISRRFIDDLVSWHMNPQTSMSVTLPSTSYYPVAVTRQSWRDSVPTTA